MTKIVIKNLWKIKEKSSEKEGKIFQNRKSWDCFDYATNRKCL